MKIYAAYMVIDETPIGYYRNYEDAVNALYKCILDDEDEYDSYWELYVCGDDYPEEYADMCFDDATDEVINAYNEWLANACRDSYFSDALCIKEIEVE